MKKIIILSIILLPLLTGCYNYRELNNLSIVTAISIEKNNDLYKVTVQVVNPRKDTDTSKGNQPSFITYNKTSKSIQQALREMITGYTREAGVRSLERKLGEICRKAARELLKEDKSCIRVNDRNLEKYLGKPRFHSLKANQTDEIGIVRGLAWTSVGGDTLQIEVNMMPGKGELELTGQLGDVMKESAMTGLSYIRSVSERYQIDPDVFKKNDFHIHIPEGAVPKDGPSAGITMATALLSALTHTPVRADLAMTGEITLRGRVLPIGGLKEKTLAAKTAGIKTVLVPEKNRPDVEEIPAEIKNGLELLFVETMDDVIAHAFVGGKGNN